LQLTAHAVGTIEIASRSTTAGYLTAAEKLDMPTLSNGLLRTALTLKLSHIKLATRSYLRDRTQQAISTVTGYAIGASLVAAAGVFFIAACLVGASALFRWIELKYGLFPAFGAIGALLLVVAAVCTALAVRFLKRLPPQFPSLAAACAWPSGLIRSAPTHEIIPPQRPRLRPWSPSDGLIPELGQGLTARRFPQV
jgi:hypothetical protein